MHSGPVILTSSHTAETLGYTLIRIRGVSVPSQFADRTRPLIFAERERERFDKAMSYVWALISQSETLVLRNPEAIDGEGYVVCDVSVKIGGHELNLSGHDDRRRTRANRPEIGTGVRGMSTK